MNLISTSRNLIPYLKFYNLAPLMSICFGKISGIYKRNTVYFHQYFIGIFKSESVTR